MFQQFQNPIEIWRKQRHVYTGYQQHITLPRFKNHNFKKKKRLHLYMYQVTCIMKNYVIKIYRNIDSIK